MHLRSPIIIGLWSAIFPGMGHLLLSKYITGFILLMWEIAVNVLSHLNLAIFTRSPYGSTWQSRPLTRAGSCYTCPFTFSPYGKSYRTAVDLNNQFILAAREDAEVQPFILHLLGINYLDRNSPWSAVVWSMLSPGVGQLIIHRIVVAFFLIGWCIAVIFMSKALPAIHNTLAGNFEQAKAVADIQWTLNIPSLYFFGIYDAYVNTVESNKLFDWEQGKFLKRQYQNASFRMPSSKRKGDNMYIVSAFEHSIRLETAVTAVEMKGIPKEKILAVPLDKRNEGRMLFDTIHQSDGISMFDFPVILAAIFGLLGLIYGFLLAWGPVLWALIGTGACFFIGLGVKLITTKKRANQRKGFHPEVVLIIDCGESQMQMVQDILWANYALGVAKLGL
jgi:hypothetical protein